MRRQRFPQKTIIPKLHHVLSDILAKNHVLLERQALISEARIIIDVKHARRQTL
jgi:hypothetical protein